MAAYFGVIHKSEESDYSISWPDFPGCISAGATLEELDAMAHEALQLHIEGMREDGDALPEPSSHGQVYDVHKNDPDFFGVMLVSAPAEIKYKPISLRVAEPDLAVIDSAARAHGMNRTAFMVAASKQAAKGRAFGEA